MCIQVFFFFLLFFCPQLQQEKETNKIMTYVDLLNEKQMEVFILLSNDES